MNEQLERGSGKNRRTLKKIPYYPTPQELYKQIVTSKGWPYKIDIEEYLLRDRCLIALTYLIGTRISETLKLMQEQFIDHEDYIEVRAIELSKSSKQGKQRNDVYRSGQLPKTGERSPLTDLVVSYIKTLDSTSKLFPFKPSRAWQILKAFLPESTLHWLRAYCEDYLYSEWDHDILAVSDYVKVDARTLQLYIRRRYTRYKVV